MPNDFLPEKGPALGELEAKNRLISAFLDITPLCIALFDDSGIIYLNESFKFLLGVSSVDEFRSKYKEVVSLIVNRFPDMTDDITFVKWSVDRTSSGENDFFVQIKLPQNADSQTFLLTAVGAPDHGMYLLSLNDITGVEREKRHYKHLSEYDSLTRVYNRYKINKEMDKEISRVLRYRQPLSALMIDIDHFKRVNDTYGHQVGDIVLVEFATLIKDGIRETDILGRYGGEEFVLLMPSTPLSGAVTLANRLCKCVEARNFAGAGRLTCSIGVTECQPGESAFTLIKRVDDALYLAKSNGRNKVEVS